MRLIRSGGGTQEQEGVVFDALGRLLTRARPDAGGTMRADTLKYDAAGQLRYQVTRRGYTLETQYDGRGRPTRRLIPTVGNFTLSYGGANDELSAITADAGYADSVGGSNVNAAWVYDQSGRLKSDTAHGSRTTSYSFDAYDRVSSYLDAVGTSQVKFHASRGTPDTLVTPHGDRVAYSVDAQGRLNGPFVTGGAQPFGRSQVWAAQGGLRELYNESGSGGAYYQPGVFIQRDDEPDLAYDSLSPEWQERAGLGASLVVQRDSLQFDGWGRVTLANYWKPNVFDRVGGDVLKYDSRGNLSIDSVGVWSFSSPGNHLTSGNGCTYSYDAAGNLVQRVCGGATTTFTYDALERLTNVSLPGGASTAYSHDALGQRIAIWSSASGTTRFVWRNGHVAYESDNNFSIRRSYTWGAGVDDLVGIYDHVGGQRYYAVQDRLHSVRALVRGDGTWVVGWRYGVYGRVLVTNGTAPFTVRFRWAGAQFDEETGLYYLRNRYYDVATGRFTQEDPIGVAGGANLFAYGHGNPTNGRDSGGLQWRYEAHFTGSGPVCGSICDGGYLSWIDEVDAWVGANRLEGWAFISYEYYISAFDGANSTLPPEIAIATNPLTRDEFDRLQRAIRRHGGHAAYAAGLGLVLEDGRLGVSVGVLLYGRPVTTRQQPGKHIRLANYSGYAIDFIWLHPSIFAGTLDRLASAAVHEALHYVGYGAQFGSAQHCAIYVRAYQLTGYAWETLSDLPNARGGSCNIYRDRF